MPLGEDPDTGLIDDEGRLFGYVNVVDALVVLLVVALVVVGISLLLTTLPPSDTASTHATVDLGVQSPSVAAAISEGDVSEPDSESSVIVTDVYRVPYKNGTRTLLRVNLTGPEREGHPTIDGEPPRLGRNLTIETDEYTAVGEITVVGSNASLPLADRTVVLPTTVSADRAAEFQAGQQLQQDNRTIATIEDVARYESDIPGRTSLFLETSLRAHTAGSVPRFGNALLQEGTTVRLPTDDALLATRIGHVGALKRSSTRVLATDTVATEDAATISTGDQYVVGGRSIGTVESVAVYRTDDPNRRQVSLGLTLETVTYGDSPQFGQDVITQGATIPFRTDAYQLEPRITRVGTTERPGTPDTVNVTLEVRNAEPAVADAIEVGLTETWNGEAIARITSVERDNATVVLTSDDGNIYSREHPINQDVTVTAELSVRQTASGVQFDGQPLQLGQTVRLDLGTVTVDGVLVRPISQGS
jgi:hypothetical protein